MKRIVVGALAAIGGGTLVLVVVFVLLAAVENYHKAHPRPDDLEYVLNWGGIGDAAKIVEIVHSYSSGPSPSGDRVEAYCIRLDRSLAEVDLRHEWMRGPVADPLLAKGIDTVGIFTRESAPWFPQAAQLNSERFFVSFPEITAYHGSVETVKLTAYDTEEHLLYHAEVRW